MAVGEGLGGGTAVRCCWMPAYGFSQQLLPQHTGWGRCLTSHISPQVPPLRTRSATPARGAPSPLPAPAPSRARCTRTAHSWGRRPTCQETNTMTPCAPPAGWGAATAHGDQVRAETQSESSCGVSMKPGQAGGNSTERSVLGLQGTRSASSPSLPALGSDFKQAQQPGVEQMCSQWGFC